MIKACRDFLSLIRRYPHLFKTITVDNGTEFHSYSEIERVTGVIIYFAAPYHSWERGTNENTNGLLRQFLPKGTDFRSVSWQELEHYTELINDRPRVAGLTLAGLFRWRVLPLFSLYRWFCGRVASRRCPRNPRSWHWRPSGLARWMTHPGALRLFRRASYFQRTFRLPRLVGK